MYAVCVTLLLLSPAASRDVSDWVNGAELLKKTAVAPSPPPEPPSEPCTAYELVVLNLTRADLLWSNLGGDARGRNASSAPGGEQTIRFGAVAVMQNGDVVDLVIRNRTQCECSTTRVLYTVSAKRVLHAVRTQFSWPNAAVAGIRMHCASVSTCGC